MNALLAVRRDRENLSEIERAAMRRAGLRYRGRGTWPIFRRLRPGYLPWRLEEDEAVFLTAALDNMTDVASRVSSGNLVLQEYPDLMLMRVFSDGKWVDRWKQFPEPETVAPAPEYHDSERLRGSACPCRGVRRSGRSVSSTYTQPYRGREEAALIFRR